MRQAHQKRSRNRGRKVGNNFNRTFDSNGPDVKIRGTASHIFDKYQSLARDSLSAGDYVAAENYYQHAEHYFRILMASQQAAGVQPGQGANGTGRGMPPDMDEQPGEPVQAPQFAQGQAEQPSAPAPAQQAQPAPNGAPPATNGGPRPNGRGRRGVATVRPNGEARPASQDPGSAPQPVVPAPADTSTDEAHK